MWRSLFDRFIHQTTSTPNAGPFGADHTRAEASNKAVYPESSQALHSHREGPQVEVDLVAQLRTVGGL